MAETTASILAELAKDREAVSAFDTAKAKDTKESTSGRLPPGIEGGVAQLTKIQFGRFAEGTPNAGQPYIMFMGVVRLPKVLKGLPIAGSPTKIGPEPLCDTPKAKGEKARKTKADHIEWMKDQIARLMGGVKPLANVRLDQLAAICDDLVKRKVHFKFRTWRGKATDIRKDAGTGKWIVSELDANGDEKKILGVFSSEAEAKRIYPFTNPDPMVVEEWQGKCDYTPEKTPTAGMSPASEESSGPTNRVTDHLPTSTPNGLKEHAPTEVAADPVYGGADFDEFGDIDSLVARAPIDEEARAKLKEKAMARGKTDEEVENADSWEVVRDWIMNPTEGSSSGEEQPAIEPFVPKKGRACMVSLFDKKTKGYTTPIECIVLKVDEKASTADVRNLADDKDHKGVAWDKCSPVK